MKRITEITDKTFDYYKACIAANQIEGFAKVSRALYDFNTLHDLEQKRKEKFYNAAIDITPTPNEIDVMLQRYIPRAASRRFGIF